jgi:hypothetical protein
MLVGAAVPTMALDSTVALPVAPLARLLASSGDGLLKSADKAGASTVICRNASKFQ